MRFGTQEIAFTASMLGLVAGSYAMVVRPHLLVRDERTAQIQSMNTAIQAIRQTTAGIDRIERGVALQNKAVAFFQTKLPRAGETDQVIKEITEMASANSLQSAVMDTPHPKSIGGYIAQPIQLNLTGDFNGFYSFLLQLEALPHATRIMRMKLEKSDAQDGGIRADLVLCFFQTPDGSPKFSTSASTN